MNIGRPLVSKEITIRDVAQEAGVSTALVSFVLNAKRGPNGEYLCSASQKTAQKIVETAQRLGYHCNRAASALRTGHANAIGVIVPDISNTCFSDICRKIENLSAESGYLTLIGSFEDKNEKLSALADKFIYSGVDGVIAAPCASAFEAITKFIEKDIPVVLFDRDIPSIEGAGRVLLNNEKAGKIAARQLIKDGCRKIAMIRYSTEIRTILDKESGFIKESTKEGMTPTIKIIAHDSMAKDIVSVIRELKEEGIDGLVLPSNTLTIAGVSAINSLGYKIPEDLAIVGFDQENRYGIFSPGIAFIDQPTNLVAEHSFNMLNAAIKENKPLGKIIEDPLLTITKR